MSSIIGKERRALRKALCDAFQSYAVLRRMGRDQLNFDLNSRADAGQGMDTAADTLIEMMDEQAGRQGVVHLIEAARAERPDHPALREVERIFMGTADPLGDVFPTQIIADRVNTREGLERVIVDSAGIPSFDTFISRLGVAEYRVCLLSYRLLDGRQVYGTGFLIASDLVMTNNHVIDPARQATMAGSAIKLLFGYRSMESGAARYELKAESWLVTRDEELDYAVIQVQGAPGSDALVTNGTTERGYFKLISETPQSNEPLLILQHPYDMLDGRPATLRLTIGFACDRKEGQPTYVLNHSANTGEGSSGSPVFSGRMDLIALHNWGGPNHNEAIRIGKIKDHLQSTGHGDIQG